MSFTHRLYVGEFEFDFISNAKKFFVITAVVIGLSLGAIFIRGLNWGIEFVGGSVFTAPVTVTETTVEDYSRVVADTQVPGASDVQVTTVGDSTVRIQTPSLSDEEVTTVRSAIAEAADLGAEEVAFQLIGPSWGGQIAVKGLQAMAVFLVLVAVMIAVYFRDWKMSIAALTALLHDFIVTVGMFALLGFAATPASLIGILTILGYSLYDTVVVFDQIRENTRDLTSSNRTFSQVANTSLNQVLVRSINTTIIGVLPVLAILIAGMVTLGGQGSLADLGLSLFIGMVAGAYSSIFLATPMLAFLREREPEMVAHRQALAKRQARKGREPEPVKEPLDSVGDDEQQTVTGLVTLGKVATGAEDSRDSAQPLSASAKRHQPQRRTRSQRKSTEK